MRLCNLLKRYLWNSSIADQYLGIRLMLLLFGHDHSPRMVLTPIHNVLEPGFDLGGQLAALVLSSQGDLNILATVVYERNGTNEILRRF